MKAIVSNETLTKSNFFNTNKALTMKTKVKTVCINTIAPGFNYKNKSGAVVVPKTGILL